MGAVHFSLDIHLVEALRHVLPLDTFVETGTFHGDTVAQMLAHFREIHTVEWSAELFTQVRDRFQHEPHIHCANESSPPWLRRLRPKLAEQSVLYWLDAHWCNAADTAGQDAQCPLLDELDAIGSLNESSVVLIDDARLFLSTPPHLHKCEQWPRLQPLLASLQRLSDRHELVVVNDVIVVAPWIARPAVDSYCREHSIDWTVVMANARQLAECLERIDGLNTQLSRLGEFYAQSDQRFAQLQQHLQARNLRIAELDARCREMAKLFYPFKALCRRMARLWKGSEPASPPAQTAA